MGFNTVIGVAVGAASFLVIDDGPSVGPTEVAEARSQLMAESLEAQWLADPANAAQTRAHQIAESLERQWIADPTNVARVRAENRGRHCPVDVRVLLRNFVPSMMT